MARILDTCAALERFEWLRDGVDHGLDRGLPAEVEVVHAVIVGPEPMSGLRGEVLDATEPVFATHGRVIDAACGRHVRVLLPEPFDSTHSKACGRCLDAIGLKG
ncbi:hypothetical protein NIIDNTM18_29730 [Mycolicibacterium litorale]|uniref:Uncharacterized protein n=1 Tax=Mycolicibacterium litorale TaxID=758802 RepID=A0A6S6P561_9MYCO|nr:hypothetical protein [Mycolicibacterium litorale]BCI53695.1 hypothetical protein NIIDNTM18_29730 [Mycolicibacterium litorale]